MSERERWIVYPLLFFALGAALRDKLTHSIESKDIICQSLKIVDQQDSNIVLAELGARRAEGAEDQVPRSFLRVDETISQVSLAEEIVSEQGIRCKNLRVVDVQDPKQTLVLMGTGNAPSYQPGELPRRMGIIQIKDSANSLVSELRADQFQGNRMVCKQIFVTDPENRRPLVQIGTVAMPAMSLDDEDAPISHQGGIILNNQAIGLRSSPRANRSPKTSDQP